jgi:hypothetical protein
MNEIVTGIAMFTAVILLLVAILLAAKRKLVAHGDVTIIINDDPAKALKAPAGGTLLGTLADNHIFIPSACGGKGACGVCGRMRGGTPGRPPGMRGRILSGTVPGDAPIDWSIALWSFARSRSTKFVSAMPCAGTT